MYNNQRQKTLQKIQELTKYYNVTKKKSIQAAEAVHPGGPRVTRVDPNS